MYLNMNILTPTTKFSQAAPFLTRNTEVPKSSIDYANNVFVINFSPSSRLQDTVSHCETEHLLSHIL